MIIIIIIINNYTGYIGEDTGSLVFHILLENCVRSTT